MRFPIVLQHDDRDCGAACLSMIAKFHGHSMPLSRFRELTKTDRIGSTLYGLIDGARQIGLESEALSGSFNDLLQGIESKEISYPFIAHIVSEDTTLHFVVVYGHNNGRFLIADPGKGKQSIEDTVFSDLWTGYIAIFAPTNNLKKENKNSGQLVKFFRFLKGQYIKLIGIFLLSLLTAIIGIYGAFVFETVIDDFLTDTHYYEETENEDHDHDNEDKVEDVSKDPIDRLYEKIWSAASVLSTSSFNLVFILLIALYFLMAFIQFARGFLISSLSRIIDVRISLTYFDHLMDLPVSSISVLNAGEYLSRFSDTSVIRNAISGAAVTLIMDSLMVFVGGILLFNNNRLLFLIAFIMILLYAALVCAYRKPLERSNRKLMGDNAKIQSYIKQSIDGVETIKAADAEDQVKESAAAGFHRFIDSVFRNSLLSFSQDALSESIELIGTALILWIGFSMVMSKTQTVGSLITFYALLAYFSEPIKNLIQLQPAIQSACVAAERLNDILEQQAEVGKIEKHSLQTVNELRMENVDFRYGNHHKTLTDVSLHVKKGESIAICGESGCGKTTIAKLLPRFYDPESGRITINGYDIGEFNLSALRQKISYVSQETFLFADTIRNNILLGNRNVSDDDIVRVCKIAQIHDFITDLPLGYDTPLDENGANLSGGQRQRLAIARALLRNPKLLILDEAMSHLDAVIKARLESELFSQNPNISVIIIAHSLSAITDCNRIYCMEEGRIVEVGTHEQLLANNGTYTKLWRSQSIT